MKKKIGFLLSTCMSVTALPLFAAACKNEQVNLGKQEEIDLNSLFKILLPQNTEKKPSELKPEDIVVKILHKDIKVEIQKVEFKEGKGVLVSYLATNSKTNMIVDEKTITLEVAIKKDVEPKTEKKYDNLVTISVNENAKQKTADKLTKEDIKLEVSQGESFKAEVISVSVQENNSTVIDVKIKITDNETSKELTKSLEVIVKKDEIKPKKNKKYDDLVTISVEEKTKKKPADEVTKEEIKISIKDGETFNATVESVSVPKKQLDTVNVKIKIVDGDTTKHISKKISGFVRAYPKDVKDGYTKFKDLKIVDDPRAHEWLSKKNSGTVIYYDRESGQFFVSKPEKDNNNDNLAIFQVESKPKNTIETAAPKGAISGDVNEESYKATALLIKEGEKVGIKFRISQFDYKTKKPIFYEKVETSNLLEIDKEKIAKAISTEPSESDIQGDQPPAENDESSGKDITKDEAGETDKKENPVEKVDSGEDGPEKDKTEPSASDVSTSDGEITKDTDNEDKTKNNPSENQDSPKNEKDDKEVMDSSTSEHEKDINTVASNVKVKFTGEANQTHASKVKDDQFEFANIENGYQKTDVSLLADDEKGILIVKFAIQKGEKKSNLMTLEFNGFLIKTTTETTAPQNGEQGGLSKETQPVNGAQPGDDNRSSETGPNDKADNGDTNTIKKDKYLMPELYEHSVKGSLFVVDSNPDKDSIIKLLKEAKKGAIKIEKGILISGSKKIVGISITDSLDSETKKKINTHKKGKLLPTLGHEFSGNTKGIKVDNTEGNKFIFSWYLYNKDNEPVKDKIYTQTIDFS